MAIVRNTIKFSSGGGSDITVVANYSALPDPTTVSGQFYWCSASQGTSWLPGSLGGTYYNSGMYYSNGTTWEFLNVPFNATQSEVNTGTNNDKFVTPKTFTDASKWNDFLAKSTIVSSNTTASNDTNYTVVSNATFTDPSPIEGKGYITYVRNGTATIGSVGYGVGKLIYRTFHSGSWNTVVFIDQTALDAKVEDAINDGVIDKAPSQNAVFDALALKQNTLSPLAFSDFWQEHQFNTLTPPMMAATAISSGTNSTAIASADVSPRYPYGAFLRSSTTANGGYRYQVVNTGYDFFGTISHKFQCVFYWMTSFTGRTIRLGYLDTSTSADSSDGAYFEILDNAINCKTASSAVRTTTPMTATLSLAVNYAFDIEVNTNGTSVTFRLYNADTSALIETQTITTNIPTINTRTFGASFIATEVSVTASDIGILRYIGFGTIDGFNRRR